MIDLKQLQCFQVCTDTGSFSEAARILYMTQSNVSKMIKALENTVGASLFVRHSKGITLTPQGKQIYQYANRILDEVSALESFSSGKKEEWLNISSNPSSWFADCFVDFYNEQLEQGNSIHSHIYTGNTRKIIKRVSEYLDEMGFVYILESQMFQFEYMIKRNHLEFIPLTTMKETLYPGKKNPYYGQNEIPLEVIEHMQFVQNFQDEFVENMDVAVVTNSDYIMQQMLKKSPLANISGTYMNGRTDYNDHRGILLNWENNQMFYGVIYRKDEKLSPLGRSYLDFVKERIIKE